MSVPFEKLLDKLADELGLLSAPYAIQQTLKEHLLPLLQAGQAMWDDPYNIPLSVELRQAWDAERERLAGLGGRQ